MRSGKMAGKAFDVKAVLDEDLAFEAILADIPLFCIGLMATGLITFILTMKRANSTALYLCTASLLLFIAAILDLGRLLIRGPTRVAQNVSPGVVSIFVVAREIGLGLSYGFLFLFIWMAVAQRPISESKTRDSMRDGGPLSQPHTASWKRWGLIGLVLKWLTLLLAILISLLQIIWRLVNTQRLYGSLYITESTLEIIASVIFLLKIVLNVLLSSATWWGAFRPYISLVFALLITAAIGAGDLIIFAFSETILGRFLRAISIYILLLYSLIRTFNGRSIARLVAEDREAGSIIIEHEKPRAMITSTKAEPEIAVRTIRPSLRVSASSRFSVLVNRAEKNEALAELTRRLPNAPSTSLKRPKKQELHFDIVTPTAEQPKSLGESPVTGFSLAYYTMDLSPPDVSNTPIAPIISEVPAYSSAPTPAPADGRFNTEVVPRMSLVSQSSLHPKSSVTSFDELMRQQNELDKSIANLRLLSVDTNYALPQGEALVPDSPPLGRDTMTSAKSGPQSTLRTDSLSQHSEFSLSIFPLPPSRPESGVGDKLSSASRIIIRKLPPLPQRKPSQDLLPPLTPPLQGSIPMRLASAETQYDVTSFIDAEPAGEGTEGAAPQNVLPIGAEGVRVVNEKFDVVDPLPKDATLNLKPMFLPSVASERKNLPIANPNIRHTPGEAKYAIRPGPRDSNAALKPFLLGTAVNSIPASFPSSTMVALGPRRAGRLVRVATHKSQISGPWPNTSDPLTEETPEAYERPRPPPQLGSSGS